MHPANTKNSDTNRSKGCNVGTSAPLLKQTYKRDFSLTTQVLIADNQCTDSQNISTRRRNNQVRAAEAHSTLQANLRGRL